MITTEVLQRQLVYLAELDGSVISEVLEPRAPGNLNDVLLAYYAWLMSESATESPRPLSPADRLCIALDIVLRNRGVPFESRRLFVARLRGVCQQEPELLIFQQASVWPKEED